MKAKHPPGRKSLMDPRKSAETLPKYLFEKGNR